MPGMWPGKGCGRADPAPPLGSLPSGFSKLIPSFPCVWDKRDTSSFQEVQLIFFLPLLAPASWEVIPVISEKAGIRRVGKAFNSLINN